MTIDITLERPSTRAREARRHSATVTADAHRAALQQLLDVMAKVGVSGERLRGLQHIFKVAFCDNVDGTDMRMELIAAAFTVADSMLTIADQLDALEALAQARFDEELAKVA